MDDTTLIYDPSFFDIENPLSCKPRKLDPRVNQMLLPLYHRIGKHWTLAEFDLRTRSIRHYDSLGINLGKTIGEGLCYFGNSATSGTILPWSFKSQDCPRQKDNVDCGVHVLITAVFILAGIYAPEAYECASWRQIFSTLLGAVSQEAINSGERLPPLAMSSNLGNQVNQPGQEAILKAKAANQALQAASHTLQRHVAAYDEVDAAVTALYTLQGKGSQLLGHMFDRCVIAKSENRTMANIVELSGSLSEARKRRNLPRLELEYQEAQEEMKRAEKQWSDLQSKVRQLKAALGEAESIRNFWKSTCDQWEKRVKGAREDVVELKRSFQEALNALVELESC